MNAFVINAYRSILKTKINQRKLKNFSVMAKVKGKTCFGKINDVIELYYHSEHNGILFLCDWVIMNSRGLRKGKRGFTLLNFSHKIYKGGVLKDDPYIFISQAQQDF